MDNALANPNALVPLVPAAPSLGQRWQALPGRTRTLAIVGLIGLVVVLVALASSMRSGDYRVLFPNLSDKDGGLIIDKLAQMNVPYRFSEGGGTILVPANRVHDVRMKLSAAGLPARSGGVGGHATEGYELLDKTSFGQTQNQERMSMKRAIEGELTRTIQSLEAVASARVQLALPVQNGFFREQQTPRASIALSLHPGRTLDRAQVAGIVHLVASSVPELDHKAVSVVDSTGALLSGPGEGDAQGLDSQQLQYRRDIEAGHMKRVLALLEPVVGRDNVRATVTAEVDFSKVEQRAETYRPNQGADARAAVREQRTEEATEPGSATPAGVPGAMSNQPPVPATAPINGPAAPLQAAGGVAGAAGTARREAATRFEVDSTVTVTQNAVGTVRRLSAAVVVNHKTATDAKGKPTTVPLSDKEIEQLTALVQQGIGFDAQRGDQVRVVNAPFRVDAPPAEDAQPLWQQPWLLDLARSAAAPAALALVALVIVFALLRPAIKAMQPPPAPLVNEVVDDTPALPEPTPPPQLEAPRNTERLEAARQIARENPAVVAGIVRGWVNGET